MAKRHDRVEYTFSDENGRELTVVLAREGKKSVSGHTEATDPTNWIVASHNATLPAPLYWKSRGKAY